MTPTVVAISGSCVTRDNFNSVFNPGYKRWFSCDLATNQSSVIGLMSPPVDEPFTPDPGLSAYDVWNIRNDLSREFLAQVVELQPAHLVLDFFGDVHFGVLRLADGRYVTNNRWKLHRTDLYAQMAADPRTRALSLQTDHDEYLALWREALDRLAAHLAEHCPDTVVTVHRGLYVDRALVPDRPGPVPLHRAVSVARVDAALANRLWAELDDYCVQTHGWESIDLRDEDYTSYAEHPWGAFWVHYTPDYYHRFLAELHKIHLRHHGADEDTWDRLVEVEAAARERGQSRLRVSEQVRQRQAQRLAAARRRVRELESLSPVRAARFALGQRLRARGRGKETR